MFLISSLISSSKTKYFHNQLIQPKLIVALYLLLNLIECKSKGFDLFIFYLSIDIFILYLSIELFIFFFSIKPFVFYFSIDIFIFYFSICCFLILLSNSFRLMFIIFCSYLVIISPTPHMNFPAFY